METKTCCKCKKPIEKLQPYFTNKDGTFTCYSCKRGEAL